MYTIRSEIKKIFNMKWNHFINYAHGFTWNEESPFCSPSIYSIHFGLVWSNSVYCVQFGPLCFLLVYIYIHIYVTGFYWFALYWGTNFRALISLAHSLKIPTQAHNYFEPT